MSFVPLFPKSLRDPSFCNSNIHAGTIDFVSKKKIAIFSVPKTLEELVNDPSKSLDEICKLLDTPTAGLGNYEDIAKHYGYDVYTAQSRFNTSPYGPSKAMILAIIAEHPDVTVESFARVVVEQTRRENVARLLREFDRQ